jgi:hypothetical protein
MTQACRESLIDLLFLSLYLDDHLSLAEDEVLGTALDALGWEGDSPRETHIWKAFSKARDAATCEIRSAAFLQERAALIKADGGGAEALTWLSRVLGADGLSQGERYFLGQLEAVLYPQG